MVSPNRLGEPLIPCPVQRSLKMPGLCRRNYGTFTENPFSWPWGIFCSHCPSYTYFIYKMGTVLHLLGFVLSIILTSTVSMAWERR